MSLLPFGVIGARRDGDFAMLLYHRIRERGSEIELSPQVFERHLEMLKERGDVVSIDSALNGQPGGVVLTFDDGYSDFYDVVLPRLTSFGLPATLYLTSGDALDQGSTNVVTQRKREDLLTWSQLREATADGLVTVGSHTHSHVNLARVSPAVAEEEMRRSKEIIEDKLGRPCEHFAYPWAVSSPSSDAVARRLFRSAALHAWRLNRRSDLDRFALGRIPILQSDGSGVLFRAKTEGRLNSEALLYRLARRGPWGKL
jgi:peptidoglycan/xylan/chitin deacetylase (PgdA/CDA1 family)